jgi:hypothetical protein
MSSKLIADQDIVVNAGQLGTLTKFTNVTSTISLVPGVNVAGIGRYTSNYIIDSTIAATTITLPAPSDIAPGWRCEIYAGLQFLTSQATATIVDHLGNTVFIFYNIASVATNTDRVVATSASFILRDTIWIVEPHFPQTQILLGTVAFNGAGYPTYLSRALVGTATITASATGNDVNRLFSNNTPLVFASLGTVGGIDANFYNFTVETTTIAFNKQGSYVLDAILSISNTGAGVSDGIQFLLTRNGVAIPFYCSFTTILGFSYVYSIKAIMQMNPGDTMSIIAGKLVVTGGTTTVTSGSTFNIKFLG